MTSPVARDQNFSILKPKLRGALVQVQGSKAQRPWTVAAGLSSSDETNESNQGGFNTFTIGSNGHILYFTMNMKNRRFV